MGLDLKKLFSVTLRVNESCLQFSWLEIHRPGQFLWQQKQMGKEGPLGLWGDTLWCKPPPLRVNRAL